ncbi:MAG: hypothetical protein M5U12_27485 [Verrucomicrobia bacterium]|nr:hypothetical protein [Verrucomicrobiota bacterium]
MAARTAPADAEAMGIDAIRGGMMADETHRALHLRDDLHDRELRLRTVAHREHRVPASQQRRDQRGMDAVATGLPASADHEQDAGAVGSAGAEDVDDQILAVILAVHDAGRRLERGW